MNRIVSSTQARQSLAKHTGEFHELSPVASPAATMAERMSRALFAWGTLAAIVRGLATILRIGRHSTTALGGLLAGFALLTAPSSSAAQFLSIYDWNNSAGGSYASQFNWASMGGGLPDSSNELARFQMNATYSVAIDADYTVGSLAVRQQGDVTLAFSPSGTFTPRKIYRTEAFSVDPTAGGTVTLSLLSGDVRVSGDTLVGRDTSDGQANLNVNALLSNAGAQVGAGANSAGQVTVGPTSTWSGTGLLMLGGLGDAGLNINAHYKTSCFGSACVTSPAQGLVTSNGVTMADGPESDTTAMVHGLWSTGNFIVGGRGDAELTVLGTTLLAPNFVNVSSVGMLYSADVSIGAQVGSSGIVRMSGSAFGLSSGWDVSGSMTIGGTVGGPGGMGRLSIATRNQVSIGGGLKMWNGGVLSLDEDGILEVTGAANLGGSLEFLLTETTNPQLNETFQVLTAGSVVGAFTSMILPPLDPGLSWSVQYSTTSVSLRVVQGLSGDYNANSFVDAADYVVWRENNNTTVTLSNDLTPGTSPADYTAWRANFGRTAGNGAVAGANAAVPEPATSMMLVVGMLATCWRSARNRSCSTAACQTQSL